MGRKNKRQEHMSFEIPKDLLIKANTPKFNPYQTGTGGHKSKKDYTRKDKYKKNYADNY